MHLHLTKFAPTLLLAGLLVSQSLPAQAMKLVETFKDWAVYTTKGQTGKVCFAISKPTNMKPKNVNRGAVFFYVSFWPGDKVGNEVMVKIGYPLAADAKPKVEIGSDMFPMFSDGDKAFVADAGIEAKLVGAMKKGAALTLTGRSKRGTTTIDKYSLSGVTAALKRAARECG